MNGEDVLEIDSALVAEEIDSATYDGQTPVRAATELYRYEFAGWDTQVDADTGDVYNYAQFDEILIKIIIPEDDGDVADGEVEFNVSDIDPTVEIVEVRSNGISVSLPVELFAGCETVKVSMKYLDASEFPMNLQSFVEGKKILSLELFLDGAKTADFGGIKVSVAVDYALADGEDASTLAVWYFDDAALTLEEVDCSYENGVLTITMDHFSYWLIGHKDPVSDGPEGLPIAIAVLMVILVGLCVALLRMKR